MALSFPSGPVRALTLAALCWPVIAGAAAPQRAPKGVPQNAVWYTGNQGSWFAVIEDPCTWQQAKERCELAGGQLAVAADAKTWEVVSKVVPRFEVWLGATDEAVEGKWVWVDGTPMTWNTWRRNEPDNRGGNEDALVASWTDVPSNADWVKGYICQWKSFDGLMALRFDVAKRGELEVALAFQKEIDHVTAGGLVTLNQDAKPPKVLLQLRRDHIGKCHFADIERARKAAPLADRCNSLLEKIQTKLLKEGMIEHAQQVKMLRASIVRLGA
ncbi:lectin-like protein [Luteolibacter sp. GHJ8]|uniref:Lectin-like protein n=1 Tax=Luteolibacter rhizosphaerae TaxID=2989719 RepID=A0ABT3GAG9_9BACT|nr:lectin-like protein [Luteolibacter rhizosphaerae]MCW1916235.1 lectin-like protein [Luteolibacter rhizosphaerae]